MEKNKQVIEALKTVFLSLSDTVASLKNNAIPHYTALYGVKIGALEIELLEKTLELKALKKKIQFAQKALNRDEHPDIPTIEKRVSEMLDDAYTEILESKKDIENAEWYLNGATTLTDEEYHAVKTIYKKAAKKLHPDLNPDGTEEHILIWHAFYNAYKANDLELLRALEIIHEDLLKNKTEEEEISTCDDAYATEIERLKEAMQKLEQEEKKLRKEFPLNIAKNLDDADWIARQQESLNHEISRYAEAIDKEREIYELITETYG